MNVTERCVTYATERANVTVHIPDRSPAEQKAYEQNIEIALKRFYHHVLECGLDWDTVTKGE